MTEILQSIANGDPALKELFSKEKSSAGCDWKTDCRYTIYAAGTVWSSIIAYFFLLIPFGLGVYLRYRSVIKQRLFSQTVRLHNMWINALTFQCVWALVFLAGPFGLLIILALFIKINNVDLYAQGLLTVITFHPLGEALGSLCLIRSYRDFIVKNFKRLLKRVGIYKGPIDAISVAFTSVSNVHGIVMRHPSIYKK